jgi:hypothetical protein
MQVGTENEDNAEIVTDSNKPSKNEPNDSDVDDRDDGEGGEEDDDDDELDEDGAGTQGDWGPVPGDDDEASRKKASYMPVGNRTPYYCHDYTYSVVKPTIRRVYEMKMASTAAEGTPRALGVQAGSASRNHVMTEVITIE